MSGSVTASAEVIGSSYQAMTKEFLPNAVDCHTRRQRVIFRDQPAGQRKPTQILVTCVREERWQKRGRIRVYLNARLAEVSPDEKVRLGQSRIISDGLRLAQCRKGSIQLRKSSAKFPS